MPQQSNVLGKLLKETLVQVFIRNSWEQKVISRIIKIKTVLAVKQFSLKKNMNVYQETLLYMLSFSGPYDKNV